MKILTLNHANEFDFEYGDDFARLIDLFQPTFCKVLVRYNPEGDFHTNRRQLLRLRRLSNYLHSKSRSRFMVELLVLPEPSQLNLFRGNKTAYDVNLRPKLTELTIHQLQNSGIEPDVWKIEGLSRQEDCRRIIATERRDGRNQVGCLFQGRGENGRKMRD
jgi:myo-inositol catabolism protein IolC